MKITNAPTEASSSRNRMRDICVKDNLDVYVYIYPPVLSSFDPLPIGFNIYCTQMHVLLPTFNTGICHLIVNISIISILACTTSPS